MMVHEPDELIRHHRSGFNFAFVCVCVLENPKVYFAKLFFENQVVVVVNFYLLVCKSNFVLWFVCF